MRKRGDGQGLNPDQNHVRDPDPDPGLLRMILGRVIDLLKSDVVSCRLLPLRLLKVCNAIFTSVVIEEP